MQRIQVYLSKEELNALRKAAKRSGLSVSELRSQCGSKNCSQTKANRTSGDLGRGPEADLTRPRRSVKVLSGTDPPGGRCKGAVR